jgi:tetratricopeptide (TPR) repeat protein
MIRQKPPLPSPARVVGLCLALAAITFAVFGQTLTHEFVDFDDNAYVYDNPIVTQGLTLKGIVWAFTHTYVSNWHPLTWLSDMLDCQLYGLRPAGHHLTNVLFHTATVIALFLVLRQMTGALWRSAFIAAVFAIHPLRVESVAWVAERKDVLSGLFFMLTIGAYVRYARHPWSLLRYGLVMFLFALGLMCKQTLVTLPLVLLSLDYWPLQRVEGRKLSGLILEKLPLLALSIAAGVVTLLAQNEAMLSTASLSVPMRLANALVTCVIYFRQMICPAGLAVFYPYPRHGMPLWEVALAGALLIGLSAAAFVRRRQQPWLLTGWLWYLVMLLPVIGIIQAGNQAHADRYTYLPLIGIYVAVTWLAAEWRISRVVFGSLMSAVIAALMVCAWKQTASWKNSETLWSHALACTANSAMAHYGMGNVFLQKKSFADAVTHYQKALQITPDYAEVRNNLGLALFKQGKTDESIPQFQKVLQLEPGYTDAHYNLGNAFLQKGRLDEAIACYQRALQIQPDHAGVHGNLGIALFRNGKTDEAIRHFQVASQLRPNDAQTHFNLANALRKTGKLDQAIPSYQRALQIQPDYADARYNFGIALLEKGRMDESATQLEKALQLEPENPQVQNTLAWLLATSAQAPLRNGNEAVRLARQASALAGGKNPVYLRTLAAALAEVGQFGEATQSARQAMVLVRAAGREDMAKDLNDDLKRYEAGLPLHE